MKIEMHKIDPHLSEPKGQAKPADDCESVLDGKERIGGVADAKTDPTAANQNGKPRNEGSDRAGSPKRLGPRGTARNEDAGL